MRPSSDIDEIHVPPELGLHDRQSRNAGVLDGVSWHEREAQPGRDHRQSPVVPLAPIGRRACDALLLQNLISIPGEFAIHAMNIGFAIHLPYRECLLVSETMA